jgi:hypothetical protein
MSSTSRSLVLGTVSGLALDQATPFLRSLRATGYEGRVCLFLDRMSPAAIAGIRQLADEVVILDGRYERPHGLCKVFVAGLRRLKRTRGARRFYHAAYQTALQLSGKLEQNWRTLEYHLEGLQSLRYVHYREYIDQKAIDADYVMISDVRDVVFQSDPFSQVAGSELRVFLEPAHVQIRSNLFNSRWLLNLYGPQVLDLIGDHVVSCSGTTLGTRAGILRYLTSMATQINSKPMPLGSHDQGIHNYLLRTGGLDPVDVVDNEAGEVLTMGELNSVREDDSGLIRNSSGAAPAVLHQYDRHVDLALRIWRSLDASADVARPGVPS